MDMWQLRLLSVMLSPCVGWERCGQVGGLNSIAKLLTECSTGEAATLVKACLTTPEQSNPQGKQFQDRIDKPLTHACRGAYLLGCTGLAAGLYR